MDFVQIPVFGQSVKPGLGLRFRGNYWAFFERRTELSPWLALHRESINDTELDELMLHGFPRTRTGETVDCKVLSHFGLVQGDLYADGFFVGRSERQRTAAFTGDLVVIKIPASVNPQKDLLNPGSIYWASESKLLEHSAGTPEYERGKALVEMATILLARWREHDAQNLEFKVKNRIAELWEEGKAIGSGVGAAAMGFIEGLWNLIKVSVEFTANALKATSKGFEILINSNFAQIQQMLAGAGMAAYNTAQEMIAAVNEGLRILNRIGSDQLLRAGLFEFLDGYSESVPHLRRLRNASTVVVAIGIEVVLALATFGGSLAVGVARAGAKLARGASKVGPFTVDALRHLARYANALDKAQAQKMPALESAPKAPSNAKAAGNAGGSKGGSADPTAKTPENTSQGSSSPKVADTKTAGEPISMINGEELLQLLDCSMPGLVGLNWQRTYRSSLAEQGFNAGLGAGWAHPLSQHIEVQSGALNFVDEEGRTVYFKPLKVGQRCTNTSEFLTVVRTGENAYQLQNSNGLGLVWHFENIDGGASLNCALVRIEDAFGNALRVEYKQGLPTQLHTSQTTWVLAYNEQGLLLQIAQLAQGDTAHTCMNQLVLVKYRYNANGQLVAATDAAGFEEHYAYNPRNVLVQRTLKSGYNIYFEWEQVGEHSRCVRQWGDPVDGQPTYQYRFEWDIHGTGGLAAVNASIDSRGARTEYQFNAQGLPVFEKGPEGAVTLRYRYDSERNLVELQNENGQSCHFEYDLAERLVKESGFDGRVQTYQYNASGHLLEKQDWGVSNEQPLAYTRYTRDALGRLLKAEQSDGEEASYSYNPQGQLVQANNAHRKLQWEVDAEGRVLAELQDQHRIEHQYNPAGWLKQSSWGGVGGQANSGISAGQLAYQYNALGLISEISFNGELLAQFERDTLGREVARKLSNQVQTQSLYDPQGRLVGQVNRREKSSELSPTVSRRRYCYNQRNQLVRIDDQGHGTSLYHYDQLDRLRVVEGPTPEAFLFDPASNLLEALEGQEASDALSSKVLPEVTSPNARRPQQTPGNRLKRQGNRRFSYDERGNRIEEIIERGARLGQVTRYSYNAQNQLVEVNAAGVVTRYAYDALGRRISKSSEQGNTTFYWNGDVLLGEVGINRSRTYLFEPFSFKPLALVQQGDVFHYHTDHIGTPREITNANAEVVWSSTFKTYGALALAHVNEVENPLRFQGQYFDVETGLHYNRHRYYDPNCGQFTTQDPIGLHGGLNAYQYAPNPMTWVDPWGLSCKEGSQVTSERSAFVRMAENSRDPDFRNLNHSINERGLLVKEREIAKAANWRKADGSTWWPPYDGAIPGTQQTITLERGVVIDRYGRTSGTFVSPAGLPLGSRALASAPTVDPNVYDVLSPIKDVEAAKIAPWFDQPGLGTQYRLPSSVQNYLDQDILGSR